MRTSKGSPGRFAAVLAGTWCLAALVAANGCHKKVKAGFERPPAVTTIPEPPENTSAEPDKDLETLEKASEREEAPAPASAESPPRAAQKPRTSPPPEPPPPEPAEPRLTTDEDKLAARSIVEKLTRAEAILSTLEKRSLTKGQREQLSAARAFVTQARKAYSEKDYRRAAVLADKGLILAEDVRSSTGSFS